MHEDLRRQFQAMIEGDITKCEDDFFNKYNTLTNEVLPNGYSPLFYAVMCNNLDMTKRLITHREKISAVDDEGNTVLHMALQKDTDPEIVELLCDHGARAYLKKKNKNGETPLCFSKQFARGMISDVLCVLPTAV